MTHTTRYIADDKGYRVIGRSSSFTGSASGSGALSTSAQASAAARATAAAKAKAAAQAQVAVQAKAPVAPQTKSQSFVQVAGFAKSGSSAKVSSSAGANYNGDIINLETIDQSHKQVGEAGNAVEGSYSYVFSIQSVKTFTEKYDIYQIP